MFGAMELSKTTNDKLASNRIKSKNGQPLLIEIEKGSKISKREQKSKHLVVGDEIVLIPIQQACKRKNKKMRAVQAAIQSKCNITSSDDIWTREFISGIGRAFSSEIKQMQSHLLSEASLNPLGTDNDMIIANICTKNFPNIGDNVFEFIRNKLVCWIGVCQDKGMDTPIFHSIVNKGSFITIICDNKYAFECVEQCVEDSIPKEKRNSLNISRLPHITQNIYCFEAQYGGIVNNTDLFLLQLHLHKPKLNSDNWVVVSHELFPAECKTCFIFLIDERSALALNFLYSRSFLIYMQSVIFRYRGIVK